MHIPFGGKVKFLSLAQFPVDYLSHPIMLCLVLFLCELALFALSVINHFFSLSLHNLHLLFYCVLFGLAVRVFANDPGYLGSIPGRVIPKTQKMVLDASLLNTQHYKVRIKSKVEQSRERSNAPTLHLGVVAIEKGAFGSPSTMVTNYYY